MKKIQPYKIFLFIIPFLFLLFDSSIVFSKDKDPSLVAPPVNLNPGKKYASENRFFQGIPGIERASNGRLWAIWYGGGITEGGENYVMVVTSGDSGKTWSDLKIVIDPPGPVRAYDSVLWIDPTGKLWAFWAQSYHWWDGRSGVWAITTTNPQDENPVWSSPRRICDGIMMNKPTVLSTGEWIIPAAIWRGKSNIKDFNYSSRIKPGTYLKISKDQGQTWSQLGTPEIPEVTFDEHMLVERKDGTLWTLVRTSYGIGESFSQDRGKTWSPGKPSSIPHINARFFIRRLISGNLLLVRHNPPKGKVRNYLTAYISEDDGQSWKGGLVLDARNGVSYPDGIEDETGLINIIYDYSRRGEKKILLAKFREKDVIAEKGVSKDFQLRILINQATGKITKKK